MATGDPRHMSTQRQIQQSSQLGAPTPVDPQSAASPPSRRDLTSWWAGFKKKSKKEDEKGTYSLLFALRYRGGLRARMNPMPMMVSPVLNSCVKPTALAKQKLCTSGSIARKPGWTFLKLHMHLHLWLPQKVSIRPLCSFVDQKSYIVV